VDPGLILEGHHCMTNGCCNDDVIKLGPFCSQLPFPDQWRVFSTSSFAVFHTFAKIWHLVAMATHFPLLSYRTRKFSVRMVPMASQIFTKICLCVVASIIVTGDGRGITWRTESINVDWQVPTLQKSWVFPALSMT